MAKRSTPPNDPEYKKITQELGSVTANKEFKKELATLSFSRTEAVLKAWAAGMSFAEIAEKFELGTASRVRMIVEKALARSDIGVDRDAERQRFARALMAHHRTAFDRAQDSDEPQRMEWMKMDVVIIDRLSRLLGTDAPSHVVITPATEQFNELVSRLAKASGAQDVIEADPMMEDIEDAEVIEADE